MQPSRLQERTHKRSASEASEGANAALELYKGRDLEVLFKRKHTPGCISRFHVPQHVPHPYGPSKLDPAVRVFLVGLHLCRRNELHSAQEVFKPCLHKAQWEGT